MRLAVSATALGLLGIVLSAAPASAPAAL